MMSAGEKDPFHRSPPGNKVDPPSALGATTLKIS
jgi:hypothetical protein